MHKRSSVSIRTSIPAAVVDSAIVLHHTADKPDDICLACTASSLGASMRLQSGTGADGRCCLHSLHLHHCPQASTTDMSAVKESLIDDRPPPSNCRGRLVAGSRMSHRVGSTSKKTLRSRGLAYCIRIRVVARRAGGRESDGCSVIDEVATSDVGASQYRSVSTIDPANMACGS